MGPIPSCNGSPDRAILLRVLRAHQKWPPDMKLKQSYWSLGFVLFVKAHALINFEPCPCSHEKLGSTTSCECELLMSILTQNDNRCQDQLH